MKKIVALILALIMIMGICAVASADDWKFERGITIVCPWGLGFRGLPGAQFKTGTSALLWRQEQGLAIQIQYARRTHP